MVLLTVHGFSLALLGYHPRLRMVRLLRRREFFCPLYLCDLPPFVYLSPFIGMFSPTVPGGDTPCLTAGDARAERGRTRG